jgi:hypothetical protein
LIYNKLVSKIVNVFDSSMRGDYGAYRLEKELHIPPRMHAFFMSLKKTIEEDMTDFLSPDYSKIVTEHDEENLGCGLPNFLSDPVFRTLFLAEFDEVIPGAVQVLLRDVRDFMQKVLFRFVEDVMAEFPRLLSTVRADVQAIVQRAHNEAACLLHAILESERSCALTLDESGYERLLMEMHHIAEGKQGSPATGIWLGDLIGIEKSKVQGISKMIKEQPRVFNMQTSLAAYSKLVCRQLYDRIAKLCKLIFETRLLEQMHESMRGKDIDFIRVNMQQDQKLVFERKQVENSIRRLESCLMTIEAL